MHLGRFASPVSLRFAFGAENAKRGLVGLGNVVKRAFSRGRIEFEIVEEIIDDLAIVEPNLRELTTADFNDLVNVADLTGVLIIHGRIIRFTGLRVWRRFRPT